MVPGAFPQGPEPQDHDGRLTHLGHTVTVTYATLPPFTEPVSDFRKGSEMPSTTDVLDDARKLVQSRLADLNDERKRLERALAELGGKAARRGPGRPRGTRASSTGAIVAPRKRRKRGGGSRADQAVGLISKEPGISASDIAKSMRIKPNYLYRVLGDLEKEKRVKKDGRKYFPTS